MIEPHREAYQGHICWCLIVVPGTPYRDPCSIWVDSPDQPFCDGCEENHHSGELVGTYPVGAVASVKEVPVRNERQSRPQGGVKSDAARAAYWRLQFESTQGALADLIVEHREMVDGLSAIYTEWAGIADDHPAQPLLDQLRDLLDN